MYLLSSIFQFFDLQIILVGLVVLLLVLWLKDMRHGLHMPPGPIEWPFVGSLPSLALFGTKDPVAYMKKMGDKYGGLYSLKLGDYFVVVVTDYKIMKEALVKQGDVFSTRPDMELTKALEEDANGCHGIGVAFANGRIWQVLRRFAMQSMRDFGVGKKSLEGKIQVEAMSLVEEFDKNIGRSQDPSTSTKMAVTNIICSIIFGDRYKYGDKEFLTIIDAIKATTQAVKFTEMRNLFKLFSLLPYPENFKRLIEATNQIRDVIVRQIEEHRKTLDASEDRDIIDLCIRKQNGDGEDADIFRDEMFPNFLMDLFVAGSETTATTLGWAYVYMVEHPVIQEKCFQEIDKVLGDRLPTMADRPNLPFVDATISEIQRVRTVVPMGLTHSTSDEATLNGFRIPKGTWVFPLLHGVHIDEKHWKEPMEFNPERFLDAFGNYVKNEALIPFSLGPRMCAGEILARMELFLFFTIMLQKFRFSKASIDQKIDLTPDLGVTWASTPQHIRLMRR